MKIMLDTNILISAVLFPRGKAALALNKALASPYDPMISDYVLDEFRRKFSEKFRERQEEMEAFLSGFLTVVQVVVTPEIEAEPEGRIRDPKDRPILRAALDAHADLFLTGDKDFLESQVTDPRIVSVTDFLEL